MISFQTVAKIDRSERDFQLFTSGDELKSSGWPCDAPPKIDWGKSFLVGICSGNRFTGGYRIKVLKIEAVENRLLIWIKESVPKPGAVLSQAITSPGELVAVARQGVPESVNEVWFVDEAGERLKVKKVSLS